MAHAKVMTLAEAVDAVFAYLFTPTILVNTAVNAAKSDAQAIDTALGAMSVGQGFVNMLGKSTPGTGLALSTFSLQRDVEKLIADYGSKEGKVSTSTIWSASSNILATVASFATGAALLGAAAPALTISAGILLTGKPVGVAAAVIIRKARGAAAGPKPRIVTSMMDGPAWFQRC